MDQSYEVLGQLIRSSSEAATFQRNKLKELSTKDFPFSGSRLFIEALQGINEEIIDVLDEYRKHFESLQKQGTRPTEESDNPYSELQQNLILHSRLIWYFNTLVHYVEQTAREYVSQSTVFLVSHLAQNYTRKYLFSWKRVPGDDTKNLIQFMKKRLGISFKDGPVVEKSPNNTIKLTSGDTEYQILLLESAHKAVLVHEREIVYEFICKRTDEDYDIHSGDSIFLLTPVDKQNFHYFDIGRSLKKFVQVFPNSDRIMRLLPENVSVLSFPDIYRDNIVANILLAHEIGHFIVNVRNLASTILTKIHIDEEALNKCANELSAIEIPGSLGQKRISDYVQAEKLRTILRTSVLGSIKDWIEELLCDMIAFKLSGPVFVFGLAELLLSSADHSSQTHDYPSAAYRIRAILSEIDKMGFVNRINNSQDRQTVEKLFDNMKSYLTTPTGSQSNIIFDPALPSDFKNQIILFEIVSAAVVSADPEIRKVAEDVTEDLQYLPETFGNDISILLRKLEEIIPPCEIESRENADIISIINAGILYKMTWRSLGRFDSSKKESIEEIEKNINALALYALERSILQQRMLKEGKSNV